MYFDDCQNPEELFEAIVETPTYQLMSKWTGYHPKDFHYYIGKGTFPPLGINKPIDYTDLEKPQEYYRSAKRCVLKLCRENTGLKPPVDFLPEDKPFSGLQSILLWCIQPAGTERETSSDNAGGTKTKERITLKDFIKKHCDLSEKPDVDSKCEMLMREHRNERVKLPLVKNKYRRGQRHLYWLDRLQDKWPTYRMTLTTLPPLKKSGNK